MRVLNSFKKNLDGIILSLNRYPVVIGWLIALALLNAFQIQQEFDMYSRLLFTGLTGTMFALVAQHIYERFTVKKMNRWLLSLISVALAIMYYFTLPSNNQYELIYPIRTMVLLFSLLIASIWIPTIKREQIPFHSNFLATFKAVLATALMTIVLGAGVSAILSSVDYLLFSIDFRVYLHVWNSILVLFAGLYFLSLVPDYSKEEVDLLARTSEVPKFLEILLVYIIIPIVVIYTFVLAAYVAINIGGEFWTDNSLEPLLVSYAIIVTIVYLLVCNVTHKYSELFQKIFPKIMLVVVLFQTVASVFRIQDYGMTHGRYYVILFGIFSTAAAIIFSFFPKNKSGWIAPILIVLSLISVAPVVNAFSVGRSSQENLLEDTLVKNDMVVGGEVVPNSEISIADKVAITRSVEYLTTWTDGKTIPYVPNNFNIYADFEDVYGFSQVYSLTDGENPQGPTGTYVYLDWENTPSIPLDGADYLLKMNFYSDQEVSHAVTEDVTVTMVSSDEVVLEDSEGGELLRFELAALLEKALAESDEVQKGNVADLTAMMETQENEHAKMTIIITQLDKYDDQISGEFFIAITIK